VGVAIKIQARKLSVSLCVFRAPPTWDDQFYPNVKAEQMVAADVGENGGLTLNKDYIDFPKGRDHIKSGLKAGVVRQTSATRQS
jgi:hypothetical protein